MPMPQYNGPMYAQGTAAVGPYNLQGYQQTFGYNPQQTYMPQTQQPQMAAQQPQTPSLVGRIVTANSYQNLASRTYLKVCPGEDVTLSVTNTGTEPVTIDANAAFTARRIA